MNTRVHSATWHCSASTNALYPPSPCPLSLALSLPPLTRPVSLAPSPCPLSLSLPPLPHQCLLPLSAPAAGRLPRPRPRQRRLPRPRPRRPRLPRPQPQRRRPPRGAGRGRRPRQRRRSSKRRRWQRLWTRSPHSQRSSCWHARPTTETQLRPSSAHGLHASCRSPRSSLTAVTPPIAAPMLRLGAPLADAARSCDCVDGQASAREVGRLCRHTARRRSCQSCSSAASTLSRSGPSSSFATAPCSRISAGLWLASPSPHRYARPRTRAAADAAKRSLANDPTVTYPLVQASARAEAKQEEDDEDGEQEEEDDDDAEDEEGEEDEDEDEEEEAVEEPRKRSKKGAKAPERSSDPAFKYVPRFVCLCD